MKRFLNTCPLVFWFVLADLAFAEEKLVVPVQVEDLMVNYCFDCHDEEVQKGDIRLDKLLDLNLPKRLDLLNRMQEQAFFRHMPPFLLPNRSGVRYYANTDLTAGHLSTMLTNAQKASELMTDVLIAALKADLTNMVTYTINDLGTPITGLPGNETDRFGTHPLGHDEAFGGVPACKTREQIQISHVNQINTIIEKLKQVPEGKGTMFDNTMIIYFPENGETHHGVGSEAPFLIMSGSGCNLDMAGRYFRLPYLGNKGHKTLGNLYTTLLNAHGNPIKHYGDLDLEMSRKKFDQLGSIKQFIG